MTNRKEIRRTRRGGNTGKIDASQQQKMGQSKQSTTTRVFLFFFLVRLQEARQGKARQCNASRQSIFFMFAVFWHRVCDIKKCFPLQRRPGEEPKRRQRMRGGHNERQRSGTMQKRVETQYKGQINSPLTPFLLFPFSSISTCSLLPIAILVLSTAHPAKNRDHHPSQRRDHISPPAIVYFLLLLSSVLLVPLPQNHFFFFFRHIFTPTNIHTMAHTCIYAALWSQVVQDTKDLATQLMGRMKPSCAQQGKKRSSHG